MVLVAASSRPLQRTPLQRRERIPKLCQGRFEDAFVRLLSNSACSGLPKPLHVRHASVGSHRRHTFGPCVVPIGSSALRRGPLGELQGSWDRHSPSGQRKTPIVGKLEVVFLTGSSAIVVARIEEFDSGGLRASRWVVMLHVEDVRLRRSRLHEGFGREPSCRRTRLESISVNVPSLGSRMLVVAVLLQFVGFWRPRVLPERLQSAEQLPSPRAACGNPHCQCHALHLLTPRLLPSALQPGSQLAPDLRMLEEFRGQPARFRRQQGGARRRSVGIARRPPRGLSRENFCDISRFLELRPQHRRGLPESAGLVPELRAPRCRASPGLVELLKRMRALILSRAESGLKLLDPIHKLSLVGGLGGLPPQALPLLPVPRRGEGHGVRQRRRRVQIHDPGRNCDPATAGLQHLVVVAAIVAGTLQPRRSHHSAYT
mmetsp:Transcript_14314/g.39359  ORF Transcript_14314/g.39359 Transcript_14314/m.39359 type:complete len:430 (-) Transcript_14314:28-1317(-)